MHVCKCFCNPHIPFLLPMESSYSPRVIWLLYVLAVWLSSVLKFIRACVKFVLQYGYLFGIPEFPLDQHVQDSIWICWFLVAIWTYLLFSLCEGGSLHYSLHCLGTTLLNQAQGANWGCSLWEVVATSICSNIKGGHLPFGATWLFPISCRVLCLWDTICLWV